MLGCGRRAVGCRWRAVGARLRRHVVRSPHQAANVRERAGPARRAVRCGAAHTAVDHVDRPGRGGDHAALVVVDACPSPTWALISTPGSPVDDHAVHAGPAVRRVGPVRSGRRGEPVDVLHGDDGWPSRRPSTANRTAATCPGRRVIITQSIGSGVTQVSCRSRTSSSSTPRPSARLFTCPPHREQHTGREHDRRCGPG